MLGTTNTIEDMAPNKSMFRIQETAMPEHLPRVVIVGGGFGDLAAAKAPRRTSAASECKEGLMPRSVVVKAVPRLISS
jgi:hypothetical protein